MDIDLNIPADIRFNINKFLDKEGETFEEEI